MEESRKDRFGHHVADSLIGITGTEPPSETGRALTERLVFVGQLAKSGDMGWVSGTYELTMNDASGKPINDRGKYLEVWEKQADGNWKCRADMWNSDLAASVPASSEKK